MYEKAFSLIMHDEGDALMALDLGSNLPISRIDQQRPGG